jgi:hypothetical protein
MIAKAKNTYGYDAIEFQTSAAEDIQFEREFDLYFGHFFAWVHLCRSEACRYPGK